MPKQFELLKLDDVRGENQDATLWNILTVYVTDNHTSPRMYTDFVLFACCQVLRVKTQHGCESKDVHRCLQNPKKKKKNVQWNIIGVEQR